MSSLFLFGAGASFGSGPCYPRTPPLGGDLFSQLKTFSRVASSLSAEHAQLFANDFERGMDKFWEEQYINTTELLRDMARFFAAFEPLDGNCYLKLFRVLGGTRKKAVMVTTNYDLLIERAIIMAGRTSSYTSRGSIEGSIPILKIHGSCNFIPDVEPGFLNGIVLDTSKVPGAYNFESDVRTTTSTREILEFFE